MATQALKANGNSGWNWLTYNLKMGANITQTTLNTNKKALESKMLRRQMEEGDFDAVLVYTTLPNEAGIYRGVQNGVRTAKPAYILTTTPSIANIPATSHLFG